MGISLKPEHLRRYKDLAMLLIKYGRPEMLRDAGLDTVIRDEERPPTILNPKVEELPHDLEKLGPTFVKLGQFFSTRTDLLPPEYIEALTRLQDRAEQLPYEVVEDIVSTELGVRISKAFLSFDREPIAAASLAQVHRAMLLDGRLVAVKVQRPDIRKHIIEDLDAFEDVADFLDRHTETGRRYMLRETLREFRKALIRELDFRQEAQNLNTLGENLREYELIVIPKPVEDYTTSRVLTMDFISGKKITSFMPLHRMEVDGAMLAEELFRAYLQQILIDGFYHADPHPGNLLLTDDGRIALIDLGMVARLSEGLQRNLLRLLMAVSEGRSEEAVEYAMELGDRTSAFNEKEFGKRVNELVMRYKTATISDIEVGRVVLEVFMLAGKSGIRFPSELALLGKSLLNLDKIGSTLDPHFDPNAAIRRYAFELFRKKIKSSISAANVYEMLMDSRDLVQQFPKRANKLMGALADQQYVLRVEVIDRQYLMTGLQKIANRLTLGLLLASIIIGAALMMKVQTEFKLFGYPGIAILFFILAAVGAIALAVVIIINDERTNRKT